MSDRVDELGRAFKGSQLQVQVYVNRRASELNEALVAEMPGLDGLSIEWVSPLESDNCREYQDVAFLRAVGLEELATPLRQFWPARGPVWDGLATVDTGGDRPGVILLEGKSYTEELYSDGSQAKAETSVQKIADAIAATQRGLGVRENSDAWLGPLYQTANRLAHVWWLRNRMGVRAWMAHLLFVDDQEHRPTSAADWHAAVEKADDALGLQDIKLPYVGHVLLPALDRGVLVAE